MAAMTILTRSLNVIVCYALPVIDKVLLQGQRRGKLEDKKRVKISINSREIV